MGLTGLTAVAETDADESCESEPRHGSRGSPEKKQVIVL